MESNLNRFLAASDAFAALEANRREGMPINLEQLLDAQRRVSEAQSKYHAAAVEYTIAIKNVHFEKGSLLSMTSLFIAEESPVGAPIDAPTVTQ